MTTKVTQAECEEARPVCDLVYTVIKDHPEGINYPDLIREIRLRGCTISDLSERVHFSLHCMVCHGVCDRLEAPTLERIYQLPALEKKSNE
jgi:hypothetical protein